VAVEKVRFPRNRPKVGDQKCISTKRSSFIRHPSPSIFSFDLDGGVFQHLEYPDSDLSGRLVVVADVLVRQDPNEEEDEEEQEDEGEGGRNEDDTDGYSE
jgi:hypothetical protein